MLSGLKHIALVLTHSHLSVSPPSTVAPPLLRAFSHSEKSKSNSFCLVSVWGSTTVGIASQHSLTAAKQERVNHCCRLAPVIEADLPDQFADVCKSTKANGQQIRRGIVVNQQRRVRSASTKAYALRKFGMLFICRLAAEKNS